MNSLPVRPIVVFYDSCVPWKQFGAIVPSVTLFAKHIFVPKRFPGEIVENDVYLFEAVLAETKDKYPRAFCSLLVTMDGGFSSEVRHLPGYGNIVKVVRLSIGPEGTQDKNWEAAVTFATKLSWVCAKFRARAFLRSESEESFREACREILGECFGEDD